MITQNHKDKGSFRDPAANVYFYEDKIYRLVNPDGFDRYDFIKNNILDNKLFEKFIIDTSIVSSNDLIFETFKKNKIKIFEHKKLDYITYPYEWSFERLKDAAIHHLEFQILLLEQNASLIDGSSYNIQFDYYKPKFIDIMSIKKYEDGEFWFGHKQFYDTFLNPLILKSKTGIDYNNLFKANLEGIENNILNKILSFHHKFSWNIFYHVVLLNLLNKNSRNKKNFDIRKKKLSKKNYFFILKNLVHFIEKLSSKKQVSTWQNYSLENTYEISEKNKKIKFLEIHYKNKRNLHILDIGCNDGEYSQIPLKSNNVVGLDSDLNSIDRAYLYSRNNKLNFLPLYFDATNPTPSLGWNLKERKNFSERTNFDEVIALAFIHHMVIGKNIPLEEAISWICSFGKEGVIEFVPKSDPTVLKMMQIKKDIFRDYNFENFLKILTVNNTIIKQEKITNSGRFLVSFKRN